MKLTAKLFSVLILMLLALPVFFINGCGGSGGGESTGACKEAALPFNWALQPDTEVTLEGPSSTGPTCWPVVFTVVDDKGIPANGMCVRVYTDGASTIAKETPGTTLCTAAPVYNQLTTRSDDHGHISLQFAIPSCTTGQKYFVAATSGDVSSIYSVSCP